jgi:hypothetical protein
VALKAKVKVQKRKKSRDFMHYIETSSGDATEAKQSTKARPKKRRKKSKDVKSDTEDSYKFDTVSSFDEQAQQDKKVKSRTGKEKVTMPASMSSSSSSAEEEEEEEEDNAFPRLDKGKQPAHDNKPPTSSYAGVTQHGNQSGSRLLFVRESAAQHPTYAAIQEVLAADVERDHLELCPPGFGPEDTKYDTTGLFFAKNYGGTRKCQLDLCKHAFTKARECPKGVKCPYSHKWPTKQQMYYLATQDNVERRTNFRTFCEKNHPIWLANWIKFYKDYRRVEPSPTYPATVFLNGHNTWQPNQTKINDGNGHKDDNDPKPRLSATSRVALESLLRRCGGPILGSQIKVKGFKANGADETSSSSAEVIATTTNDDNVPSEEEYRNVEEDDNKEEDG